MGNVYLDDSVLTGIANSIRAKTGDGGAITPANMATEIDSISGGVTINWGSLDSYTELNPSGMFSSMMPNNITWEKTNCAVPALSFLPMGTNFKWKTTGRNTVKERSKALSSTYTTFYPFISMFYDPDTTGTKSTSLLSKLDFSEFNYTYWYETYAGETKYPSTGIANILSPIWRTAGCIYSGEVPQHIIDSIQGLWTKAESNHPSNPSGYWQDYGAPQLYSTSFRDMGYFYPRFFDHNIRFTDVTPLVNIIRKPTGLNKTRFNSYFGYYFTLFADYWFDTRLVEKMNNLQVINDIDVTTNMFINTNVGLTYGAIVMWMPLIKEFSFELDANDQPIVANWKNQHIYFGTRQSNPGYSFDYMKLFNTLPDVSVYGEGTNQISMNSTNNFFATTPTAEEIAVATAKGWTVSIS